MTSFFSDLEDQLRTAAHERTSGGRLPGAPPPPRRPRLRRWSWLAGGAQLVPVAAAIAVTLGVVAGALVLLGHRGAGAPTAPAGTASESSLAAIVRTTPPGQLKHEFALMGAATRRVLGTRPCQVATNAPARIIKAPPGPELLSTLRLLRRPATAADRLPGHALDLVGTGVSVYAGAARRAPTGLGGTATFIVPIRQSPKAGFPSERCFALETAAVKRALPSMPRSLRARTWALTAAFIAYDQSLAARPPVDGICRITVLPGHGLSSGCGMSVALIKHGTLPEEDNGTFSGLVPDGVASVTLRFRGRGGRAAHVTAQVHDNVYSVHAGGLPPGAPVIPTVVWRAASGRVLKTYSEPPEATPQTLKQLCARHPSACAPMALAVSATAVGHAGPPVRPLAQAIKGGG